MKPANHLTVRDEFAPTKEKGSTRQNAPQDQSITSRHSTPQQDPLVSWFSLAKNAKTRAAKSWRRGNQRGRIDAALVAHLALLVVIAALIVGGVIHA